MKNINNDQTAQVSSQPSTPQIVTFGCRLNSYETEVMRNELKDVNENIIVVNTCAVTKEAERQARQAIRKLRRDHPDAKIVVTGCAAQLHPELYGNMLEVDRVLGNQEKLKRENFLFDGHEDHAKIIVNDLDSVQETATHLVAGFEGRARAFVQVQNGCDHACTYCVITLARGNNRSVPMGVIVEQIRHLVQSGYNEVVLTGVDITAYGEDLPGKPTLGEMMKRLLALVPELPRLRLSSVDPAEIDQETYDLIANEPRLMPHFHLSLQAGDDLILKRMKRRHLRHHAIHFCQYVRQLRPDVVFGADIIAGFPTETDEMFENTMNIIDECDLTYLHVFPYSAHEETSSSRMPQVPKDIIKHRAKLLRLKGQEKIETFMNAQIGKNVSVLIENDNLGRTEHFAPVHLKTEKITPDHHGKIVQMTIKNYKNNELYGEFI